MEVTHRLEIEAFFKDGDEIIDINFDEFFTPMNSASKASNLFEVISQTISTWNNASGIIDYFEQLEEEKKANEYIPMQFDSLGGNKFGPVIYRTPIHYYKRKDSINEMNRIKKHNDSIIKSNQIKTR